MTSVPIADPRTRTLSPFFILPRVIISPALLIIVAVPTVTVYESVLTRTDSVPPLFCVTLPTRRTFLEVGAVLGLVTPLFATVVLVVEDACKGTMVVAANAGVITPKIAIVAASPEAIVCFILKLN